MACRIRTGCPDVLHGWLSTFLEMLRLVDRLGDRFDLIVGVHLSTTEVSPYLGPGAPPLTDAEQTYLAYRA